MKSSRRKPQQERSRRTEDALRTACVRVLERDGLEGCSVPRVAAEAKLAPATLYRRFVDKDALLRSVFLQVLETNQHDTREAAERTWLRPTLAETAERVVMGTLAQYRAHPKLLQALAQFTSRSPRREFAQEANRLIAANRKAAAGALLRHRDRIRHEDPERATLFAVLIMTSAVEACVLDPDSPWNTALPLSDKAMVAEHTRAMVAYLRRKP